MEMKYLYYILFFSFLYSDYIYEYKIKSFGIEVAECKMSIRDTLLNNKINTFTDGMFFLMKNNIPPLWEDINNVLIKYIIVTV